MSPRLPISPIRRALLKAGAALALPAAMPARAATAGLPQQQVRVAAPFDMPAIVIPDFAQVSDVQVKTVRKKAVQLENVQGFVDHSGNAA